MAGITGAATSVLIHAGVIILAAVLFYNKEEIVRLIAAEQQIAIMCAETVWWRCHRKMIADYLTLVRTVDVRHLMHDGKLRPHRPTAEARVDGDVLVYDGPSPDAS